MLFYSSLFLSNDVFLDKEKNQQKKIFPLSQIFFRENRVRAKKNKKRITTKFDLMYKTKGKKHNKSNE